MEESKATEEGKIKVVDRRQFTAEGDRRRSDEDEGADSGADVRGDDGVESAPVPERHADEAQAGSAFDRRPVEEPEGVDFSLLVNAMFQPAAMLLEELPQDDPRESQARLEQARLYIDLLDLLRVKCRGNLTAMEEKLLDRVLYELRMRFVEKSQAAG